MNTKKTQEMESSSQRSGMHTRKGEVNGEAHQYPSALNTHGDKQCLLECCFSEKEKSRRKIPSQTKLLSSHTKYTGSSRERADKVRSFTNIGDLDPRKIKLILDIIIDIAGFDIDLVSSCLKYEMHESAIMELEKLRHMIKSIWRLLMVDVKLVDCQKDKQQLLRPGASPSVPKSKLCQQQDDYIQTEEVDSVNFKIEELSDDDVRSLHQEPSNNLEEDISNSTDVQIFSQVNIVSELSLDRAREPISIEGDSDNFKIEELSDDVASLHQEPSNNLGEEISNSTDVQIFSQVNVSELSLDAAQEPRSIEDEQMISQVNTSLDHSHTNKNSKDGKTQSSRTDDAGREFGVHQPKPAAGFMSGHTISLSVCNSAVKVETQIPSAGQDSKVTSEGTIFHTQEKTERPLAILKGQVPKCSAVGCINNQANRPDLKFFRFPLDMIGCIKWVVSCRRIDLAGKRSMFLNQNHFLCSLHFKQEELLDGSGVDQLVPTLFSFSADPKDDSTPAYFTKEDLKPNKRSPKCSAIGCNNTKRNRSDLRFFRFPQNTIRCMKWIINCRRYDLVGKSAEYLNQTHFICPLHFEKEQLAAGPISEQFVPTRFSFPVKPAKALTPSSSLTKGALKTRTQKTPRLKQKISKLKRKTTKQKSTSAKFQNSQSPVALPSSVATLQPPNALAASSLDQEQMQIPLTDLKTEQETPVTLLDTVNSGLNSPKLKKVTSTGPFPCNKCDKVFTHVRSFRRHQIIHDRVKSFICELCGEIFTKTIELNQHKKAFHKPLHTCDRCGKRVKNLKAHLDIHKEYDLGITHSCDICKNQFKLKRQLEFHMRRHRQKKHLCALCGKCFTLKTSLNTHLVSHTGEKKYSCKVCFKRFSLPGNLHRHRLVHTGERPHECDICHKRFATSTTLKSHRRMHTREKPFKCTICGVAFIVSTLLVFHRFRIHGVNEPNGLGAKPYECPKCGLKLPLKRCVSYHLKFQCGDVTQRPRRVQENQSWSAKCFFCPEIFYNYRLRKSHMDSEHPQLGQKCNICGKTVANVQNMIRHLREVHEGQRPFTCDICGHSFKQKVSLETHMWTHRSDKRYKCKLCGVGYNDKRNIVSHLKKVHNHISDSSLYVLLNEPAREDRVLTTDNDNLWS